MVYFLNVKNAPTVINNTPKIVPDVCRNPKPGFIPKGPIAITLANTERIKPIIPRMNIMIPTFFLPVIIFLLIRLCNNFLNQLNTLL